MDFRDLIDMYEMALARLEPCNISPALGRAYRIAGMDHTYWLPAAPRQTVTGLPPLPHTVPSDSLGCGSIEELLVRLRPYQWLKHYNLKTRMRVLRVSGVEYSLLAEPYPHGMLVHSPGQFPLELPNAPEAALCNCLLENARLRL